MRVVLIYQEKKSKLCFGRAKTRSPIGSLRLLYEVTATAYNDINAMGRPPKSETDKRTKRVEVAFTEVEYNQLKAYAGNRNLAGIIRQLIRYRQPATGLGEEERKALFQLAGMARNLNQLAAQANAQGYAAVATRADELANELRQIISRYDRKS